MQGQFSDVPQVAEQASFKQTVLQEYDWLSEFIRRAMTNNTPKEWKDVRNRLLVLYFHISPKVDTYIKEHENFKKLKVLDYFLKNPAKFNIEGINGKGKAFLYGAYPVDDGKFTYYYNENVMELIMILREFLEVNGVTRYEEERAKTSLDRS